MQTTEGGAAAASVPGRTGAPDDGTEITPATTEIVVVGVIAVLAGGVLRFTTASSLWLDEALSVNISELPVGDITEALRHDGHPPLYYVLLHYWIDLFGSGDVAVRAMSGVLGLLTLPLAYLAGRRRGGPLLAWVTLTVVALSPFAVRYSDEARMYSLVMFLAFAGYLLGDDVLRRGRADLWRLAGVTSIVAALLYTHYWAIWLVAAAGLVAAWRAWRADAPATRRAALRFIAALVVGGVLFVPWLPHMLYQSAHTGTPWAEPMRPSVAFSIVVNDFGSGLYSDSVFFGAITVLFIALAVFGKARDGRHIDLDLVPRPQVRGEAVVAGLTFVIGITIAFGLRGAFAARYGSVLFPFLSVLVAAGVTRFVARWVRFAAFALLCGYLAIGALWNTGDTRTQAGALGDAIDAEAQPGDLVVYCPDQLGPAGSRAVTADVEQVTYPAFGDPRFVDWVDYKERNDAADPTAFAAEVVAQAPADRGVFVVWNGEYKTLDEDCAVLVAAIAAARPGQEIRNQDVSFFEKAHLFWFPPAP